MSENEHFQNRQVTMNPKNNLLQIEEHMYILDDVEKPNVFRNMFQIVDAKCLDDSMEELGKKADVIFTGFPKWSLIFCKYSTNLSSIRIVEQEQERPNPHLNS